MIEAAIEVVW